MEINTAAHFTLLVLATTTMLRCIHFEIYTHSVFGLFVMGKHEITLPPVNSDCCNYQARLNQDAIRLKLSVKHVFGFYWF